MSKILDHLSQGAAILGLLLVLIILVSWSWSLLCDLIKRMRQGLSLTYASCALLGESRRNTLHMALADMGDKELREFIRVAEAYLDRDVSLVTKLDRAEERIHIQNAELSRRQEMLWAFSGERPLEEGSAIILHDGILHKARSSGDSWYLDDLRQIHKSAAITLLSR